jgi:hypothetical protein
MVPRQEMKKAVGDHEGHLFQEGLFRGGVLPDIVGADDDVPKGKNRHSLFRAELSVFLPQGKGKDIRRFGKSPVEAILLFHFLEGEKGDRNFRRRRKGSGSGEFLQGGRENAVRC